MKSEKSIFEYLFQRISCVNSYQIRQYFNFIKIIVQTPSEKRCQFKYKKEAYSPRPLNDAQKII